MTGASDPGRRARLDTLAIAAQATAAYPLLFLGCLYGQWLLSWAMLGHVPRASIDDPKYVAGASWMHPITAVAMVGLPGIGVGAVLLNIWYAVDRRFKPAPAVGRLLVVAAVLGGTIACLRWDPGRVVYWWFD